MAQMHKFMKMGGCNTEEEFYQKYPTEEDFFSAFPKARMKNGGAAEGHPGMFWDGDKWVSSKGGATYSNGVFYANGGNYSANGGPVFPPLGAGAMFKTGGPTASFYVDGNGYPTPFAMAPGSGNGSGYLQDLPTHMKTGGKTASFYVDGNGRPNPFAMWPGTGNGSGYLQDLPTEMKKGGKHQKRLTPHQKQMMMQAMMQQQQMQQQQGQPGQPPMGQPGMMAPPQGQMMQQPMQGPPQQQPQGPPPGMMPGMASGGIHIKKSHEGRFTAYKKRTGKTTEEALHSKDPHVRQMANFARNAAKWHHEFGGSTMQMGGSITAGGNVIRDSQGQIFAYGGQVNPYHPLAKFMQIGGPGPIKSDSDFTDPLMDNSGTGTPQTVTATGNSGVVQDQQAGWRQGMTDNQANQNINYGAGSTEAYDPNTGNTDNGPGSINGKNETAENTNKGNGWGYAGAGLAVLGAGLGIASTLSDMRDQRNLRNKQFNDRSTAGMYKPVNQPGGMGDYSQYGDFRPNQNTPTQAGFFQPKMSRNGGSYSKDGGLYGQGSEHELDDQTIKSLLAQGYKLQYL